jgi:hypothetical protein
LPRSRLGGVDRSSSLIAIDLGAHSVRMFCAGDPGERGLDDVLKLKFEALKQFDDEDKQLA